MKLNRKQEGLLMYLETRAVDHSGRVDMARMNKEEREQAEKWNESEYIRFGRIRWADHTAEGSNWVQLSVKAWEDVHLARRARANRSFENKSYQTTEAHITTEESNIPERE